MANLLIKAQEAGRAWGVDGAEPRLITHRENAVFEIRLPDGARAALRLHRPGYTTAAEISAEVWWTEQLVQHGIPAPRPVRTLAGQDYFELAADEYATVVSWINGAPIGQVDAALAGSGQDQNALYADLGEVLARFHAASDALDLPPGFTRRAWNFDGFFGETPHWGRFWENPALDAEAKSLIEQARDKAAAALRAYAPNADYGLIHADALRENVFASDSGLTLIDFDDAGFGFRLYDLAVALSQSVDDAAYPDLMQALFDGYSRLRPIGQAELAMIPLFRLLRIFAQLGWIVPRLGADSAKGLQYVARAQRFCRDYLDAP